MANKLSRKDFLSMMGASTTGAMLFVACGFPEDEFVVQAPAQLPEDLVKGRDNWFATTCGTCAGGEGVIVRVMEGRAKKIAGNPDFPVNLGKQNPRCDSALQMLYHPDRITQPLKRSAKGSALNPISWDEAERDFKNWVTSANRVHVATNPVRGNIAWVASNFAAQFGGKHVQFDPIEQGVLHAAIKNVFGQDRLPDFDIENANTVVSFGADFLGTWISPTRYSVKYGQFRYGENRAERGKLIHIEPRMSPTSAAADQWVPVNPGREGELALAVGNAIIENGGVSEDRITAYKSIFANGALESIDDSKLGVSHDTIHEIADALSHGPALVIGGGSAGAHTNGTFNLTAIYALNVLLGSVGVPGGVIYNPESPVEDLPSSASGASFETWEKELAQWRAGNVGTVILRQANLVHGLPRSVNVPQALENVEHIIAFADVLDDTSALADLVLPEASYLESWAMDIPEPGPGYQTVGIQQPVVTPARTRDGLTVLSDARSFGDVLLGAADGVLGVNSMHDLVEDTAGKLFDLNRASSSVKASGAGMFLRGTLQRGGWWDAESGVTSAVPSSPPSVSVLAAPEFSATESGATEEFFLMPFASQALGDGKFAAAPWAQATPDPITSATWVTWVEINHDVADRLGIKEGDEIAIRSTTGEIIALAYPHRAAAPNILGVPIGQGNENGGRWAEGRGANVLSILVDQKDSETGALAWASTRVRISKVGPRQKMTKLEGTVEAVAIEPQFPIVVVEPGESAEDAIHHAHEAHDTYSEEK